MRNPDWLNAKSLGRARDMIRHIPKDLNINTDVSDSLTSLLLVLLELTNTLYRAN